MIHFDKYEPGPSDLEPYEDPANEERNRRYIEASNAEYKARIRAGACEEEAAAWAYRAGSAASATVDRRPRTKRG